MVFARTYSILKDTLHGGKGRRAARRSAEHSRSGKAAEERERAMSIIRDFGLVYRDIVNYAWSGLGRTGDPRPFPCIPCVRRMIDGRVNFIGIRYRRGLSLSLPDYDTVTIPLRGGYDAKRTPVPSDKPGFASDFSARSDGKRYSK